MQLMIDGVRQIFVPVRKFRAQYNLPPHFGIGLFQNKDFEGLGSIENAASELAAVRAAVLAALPSEVDIRELPATTEGLAQVFRGQLYAVNDHVGLKPVEIDFAVAGFADVTQTYAYALVRSVLSRTALPSFGEIYGGWLENSARIAGSDLPYDHVSETWHIRVVSNAYGRAGFIVVRADGTDYVQDSSLMCPADGYMMGLLKNVCDGLAAAATSASSM